MTDGADRSHQACARFARSWVRAIAGTSYVSLGLAETEQLLLSHTERLVKALFAEPFRATPAREIGFQLVQAHFTGIETLSRTVALLGDEFLGELQVEPDERLQARIAALQGALAAGYAQALRERTLDEQEAIRQAVLDARDAAEHARRASEARFRAVFTEAAIGIGILDTDGRILDANASLQHMLDYSLEELCQRRSQDVLYPQDRFDLRELCTSVLTGARDHVRLDSRLTRRDGQEIWTHITVSLIRDEQGSPRYVVAMVEDVTDRHLLQTRLRHQALHDPLTGLSNRALFLDELAAAFARKHPDDRIGLCYLDLDGFKVINDSLGHDIGDQLLVAVAKRLDACVSGPGRLVARMGGDEFVILLDRTEGTDEVVQVAEQVLDALVEPIKVAGHELSISASIGIVERPTSVACPADLMRDADITLYWAKADGKSRWALFDSERNAKEVARFTLSATMPAALERGEFYVDYQPLVRLTDTAVVGVEALVRWQHPEFGRLGPDRFIELAEETGLIVSLGRWVLEQACRQARSWIDEFGSAAPFVSVNLAVRQLRDAGLVGDVARILADTGLPPGKLQLELTESAIMGNAAEPLDALCALSDMGVRIAIDDFGTGYSNLAYLRHLPVHELKIAGSFVEGLRAAAAGDEVDQQIVATLVSLAHALGLTVTAEGVETTTQAERLRAIGCDSGQGWLFAKPGPPASIDGLL
ncbi:diguanylate cyclase (GGDEF)-like protein/PAS domain S-box-containing protein [Crossiella equi]|uniref:Diguanylate cyclase (GGDEF)-like protein/PAS domain S-box-containing protein n=1 Tax=Crossiella equi TaxID=130796 RepID=A0ABS5AHF0_9PSEU|nr:bifunctional diguanylate cyclase/phosphodiesterase [Crossiella equi]MBP2475791.1 diguanylate cyclase (GGDEF)-like protein/PAS domain S-box-containing protein [Crossiella equi]